MERREADLLRRFRAGESGAFEELFEQFGARLYRFGLRMGLSREDSEDLASETFTEAFRSRSLFEGRCSFSTWLFRIAYRAMRRIREARGREAKGLELLNGNAADTACHPDLVDFELERALCSLPEDQREAFLLVKGEGFRHHEAAKLLGVPQGTVQYRVFEAVRKLREFLREHPAAEPGEPLRCGNEL